MIARVGIEKRQTLATRSRIDSLIYAGERKMVFRADLIEMLEVDAHSERLVLLRNHDDISEPLGVVYLSDKSCRQQSSHFFTDGLSLLDGGPPKMLFDWFCR